MSRETKKSFAGGGAAWALMSAFAFGCLIGAIVVAPWLARMVAR